MTRSAESRSVLAGGQRFDAPLFAGGKSWGGRMTSLAQAAYARARAFRTGRRPGHPEEAATISAVLEARRKAIEIQELAERMSRPEQQRR